MAKCIMVQGTMSGAGKSLLVTALCRIFAQDGYRVAPFKSQNMALNSYITRDGLEMGRAQVAQAQAAGKEPDVRMNPILLKPSSDVGSQLIVNGEVRGDYRARDYFKMKKSLIPEILAAYRSLAEENDIIVIEGAGSPAEINLREDDIVNMGLAELVNAPVLLVGDIDRGGVFAQLYGTMALLQPQEQRRVVGLVVNKFRGDVDILKPGLAMLEEKTGAPVLGVIPYTRADIDDEDSLSQRLEQTGGHKMVDIAIVRLPRISNFTDFAPLERHQALGVRYVASVQELGRPDLVILPGTKNTMGDLLWMRQNGLEAAILKKAGAGTVIFGVCGGYQMMGESLKDPMGVEAGGEIRGMGLLPIDTVFEGEKTRTRVTGSFEGLSGVLKSLNGVAIEGYEIHMGATTRKEGCQASTKICNHAAAGTAEEKLDGACHDNIYGTYVHGVFDKEGVVKTIVMALGERKGIDMSSVASIDFTAFKESQYDKLAEGLRAHLDMEKIYEILEKGLEE